MEQYQTVPLDKIEDFGVHHKRYYPLDVKDFARLINSSLILNNACFALVFLGVIFQVIIGSDPSRPSMASILDQHTREQCRDIES